MKKQEDTWMASLLEESLEHVGRERDGMIMDAMAGISRAEFAAMLAECGEKDKKPSPVIVMLRRHATNIRAIAACIIVALVIYGINDWRIAQPDANVHASMFDKYYRVDECLMQQYKNEGQSENAWGGKSTAAILEEASHSIKSSSRRKLRRGVEQLERLRDNPQCRQSLKHEVHWYLGLGYLKEGRKTKAVREFRQVVTLRSYHAKDAQEIISKLE